ncbi:ammonium transporter [Leptospira sp. FAT2]|uniref:ammonium transporter n=1 Tax=Leptospira sanjuanensis TaxID=2879643 RepID=UPI001EE7F2D2|nr:ammonium transporter [Leptospira sanjuanensis]MCG6194858.1 ammonium transporter [Leptospira sanjuanensis]
MHLMFMGATEKTLTDVLWILLCSGLVLLMQGGFLILESGLTRAKNSINVAIKNIADFGIATVLFWFIGFGLMFGNSWKGIVGTSWYLPVFPPDDVWSPAFFLFQLVFCGTAATIVSGAIAERLKFVSYVISTILISGFIYPIAGHWVWAGLYQSETHGWLSVLGFRDFAGSSVVHSVGGWVALAFLLVVGPRAGRFVEGEAPRKVTGSNLPLAMLGGIILWVGWFGFNGGSTLAFDRHVPTVLLNTVLASGAAMFSGLFIGWFRKGYPDAVLPLNGSLGGLVAITACANVVNAVEAGVIGLFAGMLVSPIEDILEKLKIDDAVGAVPVHLGMGIFGTLCVGVFGNLQILNSGLTRWGQIQIQLVGIVSIGAFAFGTSYILFSIINRFFKLRVDPEEEYQGLNISEHKATTELIDLFLVMEHQKRTGDLSYDVPVEPFTEVGQIANRYNQVLGTVRNTLEENERARKELAKAYAKVQKEQERAEKLLLNVLPKPIADKLKKDSSVIAQSFNEATILFADIVGFTEIAGKFHPEKVVRILNKVFSAFDLMAEKYGLEKIKTIGDAYMVVGGLPQPRQNHTLAIAHMAWEMMDLLKRFRIREGNLKLDMRIGINTGPVVAGVIGTKKFIYDIWGDAVNVASRMESHGLSGQIQVTPSTANLISEEFSMEKREDVEIKGKGKVDTFILTERKKSPSEELFFGFRT